MSEDRINDGGPAFPGEQGHTPEGSWNQTWNPGMSLRDWFAGQALAGMLANPGTSGTGKELIRVLTEGSYQIADAMLAERAKEVTR